MEGYQGSSPVHIGRSRGPASAGHLRRGGRLDHLATLRGMTLGHQGWIELCGIFDWLCEHWDQPEEGMRETRGGRKDFTYGRLMSWVALDRAVRMARRLADRAISSDG